MDATTSPITGNGQTNAAQHHWRFKLRTLLLLIVAASIGLAAMRYATAAWSCAIATATVLLFLAAAVLAVYSPRDRRAFWIGFFIFGGGYLVFIIWSLGSNLGTTNNSYPYSYGSSSYANPIDPYADQWDVRQLAHHIVTTRVVQFLFIKFHQPATGATVPAAPPVLYVPPLAPPPAYPISISPGVLQRTIIPYQQAAPTETNDEPTLAPAPTSAPSLPTVAPSEPTPGPVRREFNTQSNSTSSAPPPEIQATSSNAQAVPQTSYEPVVDTAPPSYPATTSAPYPSLPANGYNASPVATASPAPPLLWDSPQRIAYFTVIGHCLWAWILGGVGGLFAQFAYWRAQALNA